MDKFVIVGGFLCFAADVFAIASLATPEWVVMEFAGKFLGVVKGLKLFMTSVNLR